MQRQCFVHLIKKWENSKFNCHMKWEISHSKYNTKDKKFIILALNENVIKTWSTFCALWGMVSYGYFLRLFVFIMSEYFRSWNPIASLLIKESLKIWSSFIHSCPQLSDRTFCGFVLCCEEKVGTLNDTSAGSAILENPFTKLWFFTNQLYAQVHMFG